jgi:hypothetical protein
MNDRAGKRRPLQENYFKYKIFAFKTSRAC